MASLPTSAADSRTRADALREALATRVVVADGAMGTMLQAQDPTLEDFENLEGCNEILNITRPDIVRSVHEEYFAVGVDCVETNTFGANHSAANEYEIADRIFELSESGARIAREVADEFAQKDGRQRWVLGSIGPGTKLPSLGHITYDVLRDGYQKNAEGLLAGGSDALIVETTQDLLQTKSSIIGARRAMDALGVHVPLICSLAFETTGVMLLGSEIGAALTALEPLGIDLIGLNCSTGPDEMSEHLRYLARHSRTPLMCMPNSRPARPHQGRRALPARPRRSRRLPGELRPGLRPLPHRRLLRYDAGAPAGRRRARPGAHADRAGPAPRARRGLALPDHPLPAGHRLPGDRGAHQRQRLQEVPRGHAGGPLGRLRGDGARPDPRGRAHARPLRRLRGP